MIAFDTETTGIDLHHGAKPFFVTTCDEQGEQVFWEWDVDPVTREPSIPPEDITAIAQLLLDHEQVILQNAKFDAAVMRTCWGETVEWPWDKTQDTLIAGHLLASNLPHNLTDMAIQYLGKDISPYEERLGEACKECRRYARSYFPEWRIAKQGLPDMPSVKKGSNKKEDRAWKFDTWLPKAMAKALDLSSDHEWWTVLREYANADSAVTMMLWAVMVKELKRRDLWEIYLERRKVLRIAYTMEYRGITVSRSNLDHLKEEYTLASEDAGKVCKNIARGMGYDLTLPKGGNNDSLLNFCFGMPGVLPDGKPDKVCRVASDRCLMLPVVSRTDSGAPSMEKAAMDTYEVTLDRKSKQYLFVKNLRNKRKRDTAITYLSGYERFWMPDSEANRRLALQRLEARRKAGDKGKCLTLQSPEWFVLHPLLNPTGTDTLRWSSSNPNEQNISKQGIDLPCPKCKGEGCDACKGLGMVSMNLRYCFGPAPGREWWSLDAKNIELRLPAYEAGETEMIALFERPDEPPYYGSNHLLVAHILHPEKWAAIEKEVGFEKVGPTFKKRYAATWYQWVKNGNFAVQYGAINKADGTGTADKAYHLPHAQSKIEARFRKMKALNDWCIQFADKHGYIETMPDKTVNPRRGYPLLCTRSDYGKVLPTVPLNYRIQGTAMQWTTKGMTRTNEQLDRWNEGGFDGRIVMQVHDELVLDFPKSSTHPSKDAERETKARMNNAATFRTSNLWRVRAIQRLMEQGGDDIGIPTPVGCEYHEHNWSEGVTL